MNNYIAIATTVVFAILVASCQSPTIDNQRGAVHLSIDRMNIKTLEPEISLVPANYHIAGYGPGGEQFEIDTAEANIQIHELVIGKWEIFVSAVNTTNQLIGQGSDTVIVHTGTIEPVSIAISPIEGTGTFDLAVDWNPTDVDIPGVEGELMDAFGNAQPLSFLVNSGSALSSRGIVGNGYYTLLVKLVDNDIPVMGAVEVVRIVSGAVTTGKYDFTNINRPGGSISVNITLEMEDPIDIVLAGQQPELTPGASMTLSASAPAESTGIVYVWYINGASVATGDTIDIGSNLAPGYYRADVTGFTTDGSRAGSATHQFVITEG